MIEALPPELNLALFGLAIIITLLQLAYAWRRLPAEMAVHYDLAGEPSIYWPKWAFFMFWLAMVIFIAVVFYLAYPQLYQAIDGILLLWVAAVLQVVIHANLREGKLSLIWLFGLILLLLGLLRLLPAK